MGLIPPFFFDCVVAIGKRGEKGFQGMATGFLYGDFVKKIDEKVNQYGVFLITCCHVVENKKEVYLRFNPQKIDDPARDYRLELERDGRVIWLKHPKPEIDIAVVPINFELLKKENMQAAFFPSDSVAADIGKMNELGIMEGDGVYVLGFPLGIVGERRNVVIARSGSIARIRDTLSGETEEFLIDSLVFPGNSGGAVVSKPEALHIENTKSQRSSYLIGIVSSYVPYIEKAISEQTGMMRIVFQENSGLARVHPIDFVKEIIETATKPE
jgi:S1-C subfamily serine protease